ncbi:MAG: PilZ domain-containing protein [Thermodesulfobacteriota bacterium]
MSQSKDPSDNRKFQRVPKKVTMTVKKLEYPVSGNSGEPAMTKNMANRGVCFNTAESYENGTLLNLEIDLRGWQHYLKNVFSIVDAATVTKPLTAIAEVAWSKKLGKGEGYEIGVRFTDIYEDDYQAFQRYLNKMVEISKPFDPSQK